MNYLLTRVSTGERFDPLALTDLQWKALLHSLPGPLNQPIEVVATADGTVYVRNIAGWTLPCRGFEAVPDAR